MKSIISENRNECYLCHYMPNGSETLQRHHCMHGSRRQKAEEYGLTVWLCWKCHMLLHDKGYYDRHLQQVAQRAFEEKHGHELWMKEFGKDYL